MRLRGTLTRPIVAACLTAVAGAVALAGSVPVRLVGVSARSDQSGQTVLIEATEPVAYVVKRPDPLTVLVDLPNVSVPAEAERTPAPAGGPVRALRVEQVAQASGEAVARVWLELAAPAPHRVRSARNTICIEFTRVSDAAQAPSAAGPGPSPAPKAPASALATSLRTVSTAREAGRVTVTLHGDGRLEPSRVTQAQDLPPRVVLDFAGVDTAAAALTPGPGEPVARVRVARNSQTPLVTRVVVDLTRPASHRIERAGADGQDLAVVFDAAPPDGTAAPAAAAPDDAGDQAPAPAVSTSPTPPVSQAAGAASAGPAGSAVNADPFSALASGSQPPAADPPNAKPTAPPVPPQQEPVRQVPAATPAGAQAPPAQAPAQPAPRPAAAVPVTPQTPPAQEPLASVRYQGQAISMDFQDADLRAVLRTFAEISGLNMVIDPAVQGTVDVVLSQVPWDQALDIILRGSKLGYTVDGSVVRIAPLDVLEQEASAQKKLTEARALAGDLQVMTKALSYAKAATLKDLITRAALSPRGEVQVDERTNTLIIRDLQPNLDTAERLIGDLDQPEPQVEIEARIVQTTRDFARALGIKWGVGGRMAPELGNTTRWGFPNRGILEGRTGTVVEVNDPRRNPLEQIPTAVNLPVEGATSAIGLVLSSINGSFNLDVALSALERSGHGRILSTPRVTTQNNQPAEMTQGVQIPIQTVANNTVTVTFKDAALSLKVTPQITAASTVIMKIELENAAPDFSRAVRDIPPIDTQRAITQVQVTDGATTVIGGIFISRDQTLNERTPFLYKIPLLGWLFKRDSVSSESRELLIFITPRIMRG